MWLKLNQCSQGGDVHEESENQLNEDDGIKGMHEVMRDGRPKSNPNPLSTIQHMLDHKLHMRM